MGRAVDQRPLGPWAPLAGWPVKVALLAVIVMAFFASTTESAEANITPAGGNGASETRTVTFWQPNQWPVPVVFASVKYQAKLANTNAWWSPPPYLPTPMLAVVTFGTIEQINTAGVSWGVTRNLQVVGTGSLNGSNLLRHASRRHASAIPLDLRLDPRGAPMLERGSRLADPHILDTQG